MPRDFGLSAGLPPDEVFEIPQADGAKQFGFRTATPDELSAGTQIVYVPHSELDQYLRTGITNFGYPSGCQPGFVTGYPARSDHIFCRYWQITHTQEVLEHDLRTKANSEGTPIANIVLKETVPQEVIDKLLVDLGYKE